MVVIRSLSRSTFRRSCLKGEGLSLVKEITFIGSVSGPFHALKGSKRLETSQQVPKMAQEECLTLPKRWGQFLKFSFFGNSDPFLVHLLALLVVAFGLLKNGGHPLDPNRLCKPNC